MYRENKPPWWRRKLLIQFQGAQGQLNLAYLPETDEDVAPYYLSGREMIALGEWLIRKGQEHVSE